MHNRDNPADDAFDQANDWYHRLHAENVTEDDWRAFREWCSENPDHEVAWEDVQAFAAEVRTTLAHPAPRMHRPAHRPRHFYRRGIARLGAMVVIVAALAMLLPPEWTDRLGADSLTGHGEQKTITLADGSVITLNSDSAIRFMPQGHGRGVALLYGEAWFEVRHDASNPFHVLSGNGRITDVGTRFDVKYLAHGTVVGVEDGIVDVSVNASARQDRVRLTAGRGVSYSPDGLGGAQDIEVGDIASWRNGTVIFRQKPLSAVIAELNRYERSHLLLATLSNRDRPVSATFSVGPNSTALPALQEAFGLRVFRLTPWVTVLY